MIALDTNLLARLLLRDDAAQYARARALLQHRNRKFTAAPTVMLELVWVLEANERGASEIARALRLLMGLPNFEPLYADSVRQAVDACEQGMDFADALHLALSSGSERLATFDKALARRAARLRLSPPVMLA